MSSAVSARSNAKMLSARSQQQTPRINTDSSLNQRAVKSPASGLKSVRSDNEDPLMGSTMSDLVRF